MKDFCKKNKLKMHTEKNFFLKKLKEPQQNEVNKFNKALKSWELFSKDLIFPSPVWKVSCQKAAMCSEKLNKKQQLINIEIWKIKLIQFLKLIMKIFISLTGRKILHFIKKGHKRSYFANLLFCLFYDLVFLKICFRVFCKVKELKCQIMLIFTRVNYTIV